MKTSLVTNFADMSPSVQRDIKINIFTISLPGTADEN